MLASLLQSVLRCFNSDFTPSLLSIVQSGVVQAKFLCLFFCGHWWVQGVHSNHAKYTLWWVKYQSWDLRKVIETNSRRNKLYFPPEILIWFIGILFVLCCSLQDPSQYWPWCKIVFLYSCMPSSHNCGVKRNQWLFAFGLTMLSIFWCFQYFIF